VDQAVKFVVYDFGKTSCWAGSILILIRQFTSLFHGWDNLKNNRELKLKFVTNATEYLAIKSGINKSLRLTTPLHFCLYIRGQIR